MNKSEWVSMRTPPKVGGWVLAFFATIQDGCDMEIVNAAYLRDPRNREEYSHWMYLPEQPKGT